MKTPLGIGEGRDRGLGERETWGFGERQEGWGRQGDWRERERETGGFGNRDRDWHQVESFGVGPDGSEGCSSRNLPHGDYKVKVRDPFLTAWYVLGIQLCCCLPTLL